MKSQSLPRSKRARAIRPDVRAGILASARRVLVESGYARLSMRAVARQAGMAVGNLVYYFPSKRSLAHALILGLLAEYRLKSEHLLRGARSAGGLAELIRYYIADSASRETSRLFRELWVLALHDPVIARAMDQFYSELHLIAVRVIRESHRGLTIRRAQDIIELMGAISEGANVIFATGRHSAESVDRVARLAGKFLDAAVEANQKSARTKARASDYVATAQRVGAVRVPGGLHPPCAPHKTRTAF